MRGSMPKSALYRGWGLGWEVNFCFWITVATFSCTGEPFPIWCGQRLHVCVQWFHRSKLALYIAHRSTIFALSFTMPFFLTRRNRCVKGSVSKELKFWQPRRVGALLAAAMPTCCNILHKIDFGVIFWYMFKHWRTIPLEGMVALTIPPRASMDYVIVQPLI